MWVQQFISGRLAACEVHLEGLHVALDEPDGSREGGSV